jgi:hypothetical protein
MTQRIHIKPSKNWTEIDERAMLLLEGKIQDDGDDDILDRAIGMAYEQNLDVVFMRGEKAINPEIAYGIRYRSGLRIRP